MPMETMYAKHADGRLVERTLDLVRLLHAVDTFPQGGLYSGYYSLTAALRYQHGWVPLITTDAEAATRVIKPPLDVAFAWFVHRQDPRAYAEDMPPTLHPELSIHPVPAAAFGFSQMELGDDMACWRRNAGMQPVWPPPAPGSPEAPGSSAELKVTSLTVKLAASMRRHAGLLHSLLRPCYVDINFLVAGLHRYKQFMQLHKAHPGAVLVPTADIALLWHTHIGLSGQYAAACAEVFGETQPGALWQPEYLQLGQEAWWAAYTATKGMYEKAYGQLFDPEPSRWLPLSVPHPLASPNSPLAKLLPAWDQLDGPSLASPQTPEALRSSLQALCMPAALLEPAPGLRAGGHAQFAAWAVQHEVTGALSGVPLPAPGALDFVVGSPKTRQLREVHKRVDEASRTAARHLALIHYFDTCPASDAHAYWASLRITDVRRPTRKDLLHPGKQAHEQQLEHERKSKRSMQGGEEDDEVEDMALRPSAPFHDPWMTILPVSAGIKTMGHDAVAAAEALEEQLRHPQHGHANGASAAGSNGTTAGAELPCSSCLHWIGEGATAAAAAPAGSAFIRGDIGKYNESISCFDAIVWPGAKPAAAAAAVPAPAPAPADAAGAGMPTVIEVLQGRHFFDDLSSVYMREARLSEVELLQEEQKVMEKHAGAKKGGHGHGHGARMAGSSTRSFRSFKSLSSVGNVRLNCCGAGPGLAAVDEGTRENKGGAVAASRA